MGNIAMTNNTDSGIRVEILTAGKGFYVTGGGVAAHQTEWYKVEAVWYDVKVVSGTQEYFMHGVYAGNAGGSKLKFDGSKIDWA
jgi:hypothetical protein